jgi:hypothetical protein
MHNFKDSTGRAWNLTITVGDLRRLKSESHIDLCAILDDDGLHKRVQDAVFCGEVLYGLIQRQAEAIPLTLEAFCAILDGKAVAEGMAAFTEELSDFFVPWLPSLIREIGKALQERASRNRPPGGSPSPFPSGGECSEPPAVSESTPAASPSAS